jgi:putative ABC transport system permease protein
MRDDLKAALRSLNASKTFTVVALIVLALGIGASTAIFSVVDAVVLRGLPFDEHDRLVAVGERRPLGPIPQPNRDPAGVSSIAPQNYFDWAAQQQVFESMAAIAGGNFTLREPGAEPEDLRGQRVTAGFFTVLRVQPSLGRAFAVEHETDGNHRVAVLSDGLWRRRFGGDPNVIGRAIPLEGGSYEVIGVMPPEFEYPIGSARPTEMWVPYVVPPDERTRNPQYRSVYLSSIARLKPGVTVQQAQAQIDQIAAALREAHPEWNKDNFAGVRPLRDHMVGANTKSWMLMLLGAVGIVLLIACANVANLLLARATGREREIGIRAALGAGRWRIVRQLMVESVLLSMLGTVIAILLAWWAINLLRTSMPEGVPRVAAIALDVRVLGAAAVLSVLTGILFGIFPALQLSRPDLTNALKEGTRGGGTSRARQLMRSVLVVSEVALAVVLLVGAALFIGSFVTLIRINPGFDPSNVLTIGISPRVQTGLVKGPAPDNGAFFEQIIERVAQTPGVVHASAISGGMPLGGSMSITTMTVPGKKIEPSADDGISIRRVTPKYHEALRIPLRAGRHFTDLDRKGAPNVVIINESAAKKYFSGENAVGRTVLFGKEEWTVVGVVGDVYQSSLEMEPRTEAYTPMSQSRAAFAELVIRTSGDPYDVLSAVKSAVLQVLPDVPLRNIRTMEELISRRIAQRKLNMLLLGLFGLLGLVISAVGIYGVMAYTVSQRTREIGVRMALGATRFTVVAMVMRQASLLVVVGLVIGAIGAWRLSAIAQRFLFQLDTHDPRAFVAAVLTLALAGLIAAAIPARRAAAVDPMEALRSE